MLAAVIDISFAFVLHAAAATFLVKTSSLNVNLSFVCFVFSFNSVCPINMVRHFI